MKLNRSLDIFLDKLKLAFNGDDGDYQFEAFKAYCQILFYLRKHNERNSISRLASGINPADNNYRRFLKRFVVADWSDNATLQAIADIFKFAIKDQEQHYWVVKEIQHLRHRGGELGATRVKSEKSGKPINCQTALTLFLATQVISLPIAYRLFLTNNLIKTTNRPKSQKINSKIDIVLEQAKTALSSGHAKPILVFASEQFGIDWQFRKSLNEMGLHYLVSISPNVNVTAFGNLPNNLDLKNQTPVSKLALDWWITDVKINTGYDKPEVKSCLQSTKDNLLAGKEITNCKSSVPIKTDLNKHFIEVNWPASNRGELKTYFAAEKVCLAKDTKKLDGVPEWLLVEWPEEEDEPTGYWLSNWTGTKKPVKVLAQYAKWNEHRNNYYEKLINKYDLLIYEGQSWQGFHHHATACIAVFAYIFFRQLTRHLTEPKLKSQHANRNHHKAHNREAEKEILDKQFILQYQQRIIIFKRILRDIYLYYEKYKDTYDSDGFKKTFKLPSYGIFGFEHERLFNSVIRFNEPNCDGSKFNPKEWHTRNARVIYFLIKNKSKHNVIKMAAAEFDLTINTIHKINRQYLKNEKDFFSTNDPESKLIKKEFVQLFHSIFDFNKRQVVTLFDMVQTSNNAYTESTLLDYLSLWGVGRIKPKDVKFLMLKDSTAQTISYSSVRGQNKNIKVNYIWIKVFSYNCKAGRRNCFAPLKPYDAFPDKALFAAYDNKTKKVFYMPFAKIVVIKESKDFPETRFDEIRTIISLINKIDMTNNIKLIFQNYYRADDARFRTDVEALFNNLSQNKNRRITGIYEQL